MNIMSESMAAGFSVFGTPLNEETLVASQCSGYSVVIVKQESGEVIPFHEGSQTQRRWLTLATTLFWRLEVMTTQTAGPWGLFPNLSQSTFPLQKEMRITQRYLNPHLPHGGVV
jgi:hypothetical protein